MRRHSLLLPTVHVGNVWTNGTTFAFQMPCFRGPGAIVDGDYRGVSISNTPRHSKLVCHPRLIDEMIVSRRHSKNRTNAPAVVLGSSVQGMVRTAIPHLVQ
jgi:hypothetical protein